MSSSSSSSSGGGGGGGGGGAKSLFQFDSKAQEDKKSETKATQDSFAKKLLSAIDAINQVAWSWQGHVDQQTRTSTQTATPTQNLTSNFS